MKKMKGYVKNYLKEVDENGFSLLELVVAVGILLVLTVGGLLAYNGITRNARMAAVQSAADEVYTMAQSYKTTGVDPVIAEDEYNETAKEISVEVDKTSEGALRVRAYHHSAGQIMAEKVEPLVDDNIVDPEPIPEADTYTVELAMDIHPDTWYFQDYDTYNGDADNFTIMSSNSPMTDAVLGRGTWGGAMCDKPGKPTPRVNIKCNMVLEDVSQKDLDNISNWHIQAQKPGSVFMEKLITAEVSRNGLTVKANGDTKGLGYGSPLTEEKTELRLTVDGNLLNNGKTMDINISSFNYGIGTYDVIGAYSIKATDCDMLNRTEYICNIRVDDLDSQYWDNEDGLYNWYYSVNGEDNVWLYMADVDDQTNEYGNRQVLLSHYGIIR